MDRASQSYPSDRRAVAAAARAIVGRALKRAPGLPDWKDQGAYQQLVKSERSVFAWEWLRRQPGYRISACGAGQRDNRALLSSHSEKGEAFRWGLHRFEDPDLPAPLARPVWCSERHHLVLNATAWPSERDPESFELSRVRGAVALVEDADVQRVLISDGYRSIRLDVRGSGLGDGPVRLAYDISGIANGRSALIVLQRFLAFALSGSFASSLHRPDRRAKRQILLLRTNDALEAGADQRDIAAELLDGLAAKARWRVEAPSLRSQVQRLVRGSRSMAAGGFWDLLGC